MLWINKIMKIIKDNVHNYKDNGNLFAETEKQFGKFYAETCEIELNNWTVIATSLTLHIHEFKVEVFSFNNCVCN